MVLKWYWEELARSHEKWWFLCPSNPPTLFLLHLKKHLLEVYNTLLMTEGKEVNYECQKHLDGVFIYDFGPSFICPNEYDSKAVKAC